MQKYPALDGLRVYVAISIIMMHCNNISRRLRKKSGFPAVSGQKEIPSSRQAPVFSRLPDTAFRNDVPVRQKKSAGLSGPADLTALRLTGACTRLRHCSFGSATYQNMFSAPPIPVVRLVPMKDLPSGQIYINAPPGMTISNSARTHSANEP